MASLKELQQALALRLTRTDVSPPNHIEDVLREFNEDELAQSRETLVRKRLSQIASLLPKTQRLLGGKYPKLCREFIQSHHFQGVQALQLDAIHFARWLASQSTLDLWQQEVAVWESLNVEWLTRSVLFRMRRFRYRINGELHAEREPPRGGLIVIVVRIGRWGMMRHV